MVIPTIGRPQLARAVRSALLQERVSTSVVVVADLAAASLASLGLADLPCADRVSVLTTGGGCGGGYGRRLGTLAVDAPWVAYLDDDDHWVRGKLARQLEAIAELGDDRTIIGSTMVSASADREVVAPRVVYRSGPLATYLFERRRVGIDRNVIPTPSLLCSTSLARTVGWDPDLRRHQDWDFLLRAEAAGARIHQLEDPLVVVDGDSDHKVTSSSDWEASLAWAERWRDRWPDRTFVDFLAAQPLRYALQARSLVGVRRVVHAADGRGRPSVSCLAIGLAGIVPRRWWSVGLHRVGGRRRATT